MRKMTLKKALSHPLLPYLWKSWYRMLTSEDYDTNGSIPTSWIAGFTDKGFCAQLTQHITKDKELSKRLIELWIEDGELPDDFDSSELG